jgi:hypothetical protein
LSFDHLLPGVIADYYEIDEHVNPVEYWKYSAESKPFTASARSKVCEGRKEKAKSKSRKSGRARSRKKSGTQGLVLVGWLSRRIQVLFL